MRVRLEFVTRFGGLLRLPFVREPAHTGFLVIEHSGLDSSPRRVHERRSAGQRGATEVGYEWEPRDISLVVKVIGNDKAHWDALVRALRTAVVFSDAMLDDPQMARLRVVYDDRATLECKALPAGEPARQIERLNPWSSLHALDFRCPDPIWRETADRSIILAAEGGGWTLPETLPESWSATTGERTLLNPGDVDTPFKVRFHGEQTGGRLESSVATLPTEVIRLRGTVASGSYVEVDTGVDGLTVERVTDGERTNALGMFDFDAGDFFELLPQTLHTLRWSADSATGPTFADQSLALTGGFASAPSHAGLDVTEDLDVRADLDLDDWTPAVRQVIAGRWGADTDWAWFFEVEAGGTLRLVWSESDTVMQASSTAAVGATDGDRVWVRATLDVDNGASGCTIRFWTSSDGDSWTQLGSDVVGAVTSVDSSTADLVVGAENGVAAFLAGHVHSVQVRDGINGPLLANPDFSDRSQWPPEATQATDAQGNLWTLHGDAAIEGGEMLDSGAYAQIIWRPAYASA